MSTITVTGEALVDYVPDASGALQFLPGGSGLNTSLALARLSRVNTQVSFAGAVSSDGDGARLSEFMRAERIDLAHALQSTKPCPHVIVTPGNGEIAPRYDLHLAGSALEDAPARWSWPQDACHFHATSFASTLGPGGEAALASLSAARAQMTTSFDPNIRATVFPDRAIIPLLVAQRIRHADVVKVSSEDLGEMAPGILHDHLISEWLALGVRLLVVTRGAQGAIAYFGHSHVEVSAPRVDVSDTVGAGDTFMAGLLVAMHEDGCLGRMPEAFEAAQVARWLSFAAQAAALCCTRPGADPPRRADLEARQ